MSDKHPNAAEWRNKDNNNLVAIKPYAFQDRIIIVDESDGERLVVRDIKWEEFQKGIGKWELDYDETGGQQGWVNSARTARLIRSVLSFAQANIDEFNTACDSDFTAEELDDAQKATFSK